jgi:hypothetical protein
MSSRKNFETEHLTDRPDGIDKLLADVVYKEPVIGGHVGDVDTATVTCQVPMKWIHLIECLRQMTPEEFEWIQNRAENIIRG